ncbi:cytochrome b/b6 domain-containing protein [Desulfocurvus vexinensis]|uniref:cytochrome b/b6 domain-containing protein n=1 Tax=Desulfocurvus vexinensis TaxID=399548 RepID=UPI00048F5A81|nr:cytochrome b/b6 domain-containing protein [Desulfocurvus vexinensis]
MSGSVKNGLKKVYLYTRFERFWHWFQAALILVLAATGLEVHGSFTLLGFERAVAVHEWCAWTWLGLYVFIVFWLSTTGEWKQYVPTTKKIYEVAMYYVSGIFRGEPHPVPKTQRAKHNPLQRLTYLSISTLLIPFQIVTGIVYLYYNDWAALGLTSLSLETVATLHTIGAFGFLAFVVVHVYMTTTGHTVSAHVIAMFTGWEEVEDEKAVPEWERKTSPM